MRTTGGSWVGWWRPGGGTEWTRLAEGDSYDECLAALLDALASVRGGDSMVIQAGRHPERPPATFGRRRF
jgi:hypothetical protein